MLCQVITPVRRSARKKAPHQALESMLEETDFSYGAPLLPPLALALPLPPPTPPPGPGSLFPMALSWPWPAPLHVAPPRLPPGTPPGGPTLLLRLAGSCATPGGCPTAAPAAARWLPQRLLCAVPNDALMPGAAEVRLESAAVASWASRSATPDSAGDDDGEGPPSAVSGAATWGA
jgi:hypothetical protein